MLSHIHTSYIHVLFAEFKSCTSSMKLSSDSFSPNITMEFCPTCGNLLQVEHASLGQSLRFFCPTCPYIFPIERKISKKLQLVKKEVDDVLGGEEAWKNVDRTEATCPKCNFGHAFFMQIQIRSADEPMSTFYKCCNNACQFRWRQD